MWPWVPSRSFLWPNVPPPPVVLMAVWCMPGCRHRVGAPHHRGSLPLVLKAVCTPSLVVVAMGASTLVLVWCSTCPCGRWCPPARPRGAPLGRWWPPIIMVAVSWPCGASLAVLAVCCPPRPLVVVVAVWCPACPRGHWCPPHSLILVVPCSAVGGPRSSWWPCRGHVVPPWPSWLCVAHPCRHGRVVAMWCPPGRPHRCVVPPRSSSWPCGALLALVAVGAPVLVVMGAPGHPGCVVSPWPSSWS